MPIFDPTEWEDECDARLTPEPKPDGIYLRVNHEYLPAGNSEDAWGAVLMLMPRIAVRMNAVYDVRLLWIVNGIVDREQKA